MKKYSMFIFLSIFLFSFNTSVLGESVYKIDKLNNNSVQISSSIINVKTKIMVEKDEEKYYYNINNKEETIPLQLGSGNYSIKLLENISGKKYRVVKKKEIKLENEISNDVYLASNQPIYWKDQRRTIDLGKEITEGIDGKEEKVRAVYEYIIKNIKYDYDKINNIDDSYVPNLDHVVASGEGICYDYASLFSGILRSQGIHAKLIKGYKNDLDVYHAWNQVLIDGEWITIDTTYDAALKDGKKAVSMIKLPSEYRIEKVY